MVNVLVARFGDEGDEMRVPVSEKWLVIIVSGGYVIILAGIIGNYFRGQGTPMFMVSPF